MVEEHRFVPDGSGQAGGGWLVGTLLDYRNARSGLSIIDASKLSAGPVAQSWLDHTMPLGFHGWFSPSPAP